MKAPARHTGSTWCSPKKKAVTRKASVRSRINGAIQQEARVV